MGVTRERTYCSGDDMAARTRWAYDDIANPDRSGWDCPGCQFPNDLERGVVRCERCGHEMDQDGVRRSIAARRRRLAALPSSWDADESALVAA